jgi:hypothetical protein
MANPNIVNVTDIRGKVAVANVTTISANVVVATSDKIFKVNGIYASNIDAANTANVSVAVLRSGTQFHIIKDVSIPLTSSLDVLSKAVYLEESDALRVYANANNRVQVVVSYEEIS